MPTASQEKEARDLIARGDLLGRQASQRTGVQYNPAYTPPPPSPIISSDGIIDAANITPAPQFELPQPTAPLTLQQYQEGLQGSVEQAQTTLEETLARQRDDALTRADEAYKRQQDVLTQSDPRQRATYSQEQGIIQQQLNFAQHAAETLQKDFDSRRRIVNELETLLNEGNSLIQQQQGLPVAQRVVQQRAAQAMQTVAGRAGVLEAVIAGLDGNIALSHNAIDRASNAVRSQWQDLVAYNNALLQLEQNHAINIEEAHKTYATETLNMAKTKLEGLEDTMQIIKDAMIDPATARTFAEAGITLNDSVEDIQQKLAAQTQREEIRNVSNELALEGYTRVMFPNDTAGLVAIQVGDQTLYYRPPPVAVGGGGAQSAGSPHGTTSQFVAANFASRLQSSGDLITNLTPYLSGLSTAKFRIQEGLPNFLKEAQFQQYEQAKRDFINAVLRRESGATITPPEFENAEKQYFPQPGDTAAVITQKQANRELVTRNFINEASTAYVPPPLTSEEQQTAQQLGANTDYPQTPVTQATQGWFSTLWSSIFSQ
jgi:hypothetical protein